MPRKPRFTLPGIPQHVIQRGNNREPCFLAEQDYRRYLDDAQVSAEKYAWTRIKYAHVCLLSLESKRILGRCLVPPFDDIVVALKEEGAKT